MTQAKVKLKSKPKPKGETYGLKMDFALLKELDQVAKVEERTRADVIRRACRKYVAEFGKVK